MDHNEFSNSTAAVNGSSKNRQSKHCFAATRDRLNEYHEEEEPRQKEKTRR